MIPLPPDPWKMLGVEKNADKSDIRSAYKKLVLKTHPDKVQDPTLKAEKQEQFQKIQQAYELLNDDSERAKYEEQVQLMELRKQAALLSKNMPNSSSPRTKTFIETRNPDSKHKSSSGGGKVYEHYSSPHTRSHEEVASRTYAAVHDDGEKHARRTASYEKPSRRDEERREKEDRRRRREEDDRLRDRERDREREKEKERERERKEKKKLRELRELEDKMRDKERRRERKPYVEEPAEDDVYIASKLDKKRSSSRKHSEYREKSMSRRDRESSPAVEIVEPSNKTKDQALKETAADYIARSRGVGAGAPPAFQRSQTAAEPFYPAPAPTPPPVEFEEESLRRAAARAARRPSHDSPRERSSLHKQSSREAYVVDAGPPKARPIPSLSKSSSNPPMVPESPPRPNRSNTVPFNEFSRSSAQPPSFSRSHTWANVSEDRRGDYYPTADYDESDDDHAHRPRRGSRRTRSPEHVGSYRQYEAADRPKPSKHDHYSYGHSPTTSSRRYAVETADAPGSYPTTTSIPFRVKESKSYAPEDVAYASIPYSYKVNDQYTNPVYA